MAREAVRALKSVADEVEIIDLADIRLPFCDAGEAYQSEDVAVLRDALRRASGVLMAVPVYNYGVNAAAKNLIELTGDAWNEKPVGFLCAAGGRSSYMSVLGLANSLMLDFRCWIVPRFVYATAEDVSTEAVTSQKVMDRIQELAAALARQIRGRELTESESPVSSPSGA